MWLGEGRGLGWSVIAGHRFAAGTLRRNRTAERCKLLPETSYFFWVGVGGISFALGEFGIEGDGKDAWIGSVTF